MSSVTNPKSDRSQTLIAVIFMIGFVTTVVAIAAVKDGFSNFACRFSVLENLCANPALPTIDSDEFTTSRISSACVDPDGLKISVDFGALLAGEANIQVFTTGEDVFPTERGMSDSFEMDLAIPVPTDQLDVVIPVESMPVGEQIFGNIVTSRDGSISSHVTYFTEVSDCLSSGAQSTDPALLTSQDDVPNNYNVTCLPNNRLMVAFEFDAPVQGQFQALVADVPYNIVAVGNQPAILFFSGVHPGEGSTLVKLVAASDQSIVFEGSHTLPVCDY